MRLAPFSQTSTTTGTSSGSGLTPPDRGRDHGVGFCESLAMFRCCPCIVFVLLLQGPGQGGDTPIDAVVRAATGPICES